MRKQTEGNKHMSKINVFLVSHTINLFHETLKTVIESDCSFVY